MDRDSLSECTSIPDEASHSETKAQNQLRRDRKEIGNSFFPAGHQLTVSQEGQYRHCLMLGQGSPKRFAPAVGAVPEVGRLRSSSAATAGIFPRGSNIPVTTNMRAGTVSGSAVPRLEIPSSIRPLILTPIQVQGVGVPPLFQISSPPSVQLSTPISGPSLPPMPVRKPKVPNAAQQQAYEAYIEWRKANQPGYAEECKIRQARRVMRAVEKEKKRGVENRKPVDSMATQAMAGEVMVK